jgi:hypothetical protein
VNGWDTEVLKDVLADESCDARKANNGNKPERCLPLTPYVKKKGDSDCQLAKSISLTENIGMIEPIVRLPGCNPITHSNVVMCSQGFEPETMNNSGTFHIQSKLTGGYLTFDPSTEHVLANGSTSNSSYRQVWGLGWAPRDQSHTIRNSEINKHFSMQGELRIKGVSASAWEVFSFEKQPGTKYIAIKNHRHHKYLQVENDFIISGKATSITDACLFQLITPDGGFVPEGIKLADLQELSTTIV